MDLKLTKEPFYTLETEIIAQQESAEEETPFLIKDGDLIMETEITATLDDKNDHNELIKKFTKWRDETIKMFENKCKTIILAPNIKNLQEIKNVIDFPKCIVRLSWEVCECDPRCARNITSKVSFDNTCEYYDLEGLNDNYIKNDCNYLRLKYNDIKKHRIPENSFNYKRNPYEIMGFNWFINGDIPQVMRCVKYEVNSEIDRHDRYMIDGRMSYPLSITSGRELKVKLDKDQFIFYTPSHKYIQRRFLRSPNENNNLIFDQNLSNIESVTENITFELKPQETSFTSELYFPGFILCVGILGLIVINIFKKPRLYSIVFLSFVCAILFVSIYNQYIN